MNFPISQKFSDTTQATTPPAPETQSSAPLPPAPASVPEELTSQMPGSGEKQAASRRLPLPGGFRPEHVFTDEERESLKLGEKTLSRQEFPRNVTPEPLEEPSPQSEFSREKPDASTDEFWLRQQRQNSEFMNGLDSARNWSPLLTGEVQALPPETRASLYSPDFPEEVQHDEVAADIVSDWTAEHFPAQGQDKRALRKNWNFFREAVAEALESQPDNQTLFQEISRRNRDFVDTVQALSREKEALLHEAVRERSGYAASPEEDAVKRREEALTRLPEPLRDNARRYFLSLDEDVRREADLLAPLYRDMREAVKSLASLEEFERITPDGAPEQEGSFLPGLFSPFRLSGLGKNAQSLKKTALRLGELTDRQRDFLFRQVEEDIIAEREAAPPPTPGMAESLMQAVSRSHLKTGYGLMNAAAGYLALMSDLTAKGADALGVTPRFSAGLRKDAGEIRNAISNFQRLRTLAEERQSPLAPHEDGRGAGPQRHWLKQCLVGFSEESVAIALALAYPPALIGYGAGEAGEHYAQSEASYRRRKEAAPRDHALPDDTALSANTRFLSALVSGSLQTLIEAGAYGKTFKPLIKSMPGTSRALALTVRPYAEQKGIALSQPLGETLSDYASQSLQKDVPTQVDTGRLSRALGTWESNGGDYLASLPFVLLAGGKIALSQLRSQKSVLHSPLLQSHYRISDDVLQNIRREKNAQKQNDLLVKALRESPVWANIGERERAATLLNAVEQHRNGPSLEWRIHTPESLEKWLKLPPQQQASRPLPQNDGLLLAPSDRSNAARSVQTLTLPPFDKARLEWHIAGGLPSLHPVNQGEKTLWRFAPNNEVSRLLKDETFSSPAEAFTAWQRGQESRTLAYRQHLLSPQTGGFKRPSHPEMQRNDQEIRRTLEALNTLAPQKTLLTANLNPPRRQTAKALGNLLKKEQEKTSAHIIEDCLLYAGGNAPEEIAGHRLTRLWADDLRSGRIPEQEARAWVAYWERETGDRLSPELPAGISPRLPHAALAAKLADLSLWKPVQETTALLPPAFTETARLAQEQLAHAATLADSLTGTSHYQSQMKLHGSSETALFQTLLSYLEQDSDRVRRHFTHRSSRGAAAPAKKAPVLSNELLQDVKWMQEQGTLPVFSVNKPGSRKKQWVTSYPDGTLSSPHSSPQEAVIDWLERGDSLLPFELKEQGQKSAAELMELYYKNPGNRRPGIRVSLRDGERPLERPDSLRQKERDDIFFRANPHLLPKKETLRLRTGGENREVRTPFGYIRQNIDLYDPANPFVLIEEHAESVWKTHLKNRFMDDREAAGELLKLEKQTGQNYLPAGFSKLDAEKRRINLIEGLSQASTEYLLSQQDNRMLPKETAQWIRELFASPFKPPHAVPLLRRSAALKQALDSPALSPRFLHLLRDSAGLNPDFRRERRLTPAAFPQRERIIPFLTSPSSFLEALPAPARERLVDTLAPIGTPPSTGVKDRFKQASFQLRGLERQLAQKPELAQWDLSPKGNRYRRLTDGPGDAAPAQNTYSHTVRDLDAAGLTQEDRQAIRTLSLLRRALDDSPHVTENGIKWGKKRFFPDSADRPGGLPSRWQASAPQGEYGLRYTAPDNPAHVIRLSPGDPYSQHATARTPYVRHMYNGHFLNSRGEISPATSPDTYIPLEKFSYDRKAYATALRDLPDRELSDMLRSLENPKRLSARLGKKHSGKINSCRELVFELNVLAERRPLTEEQSRLLGELRAGLELLPEHPGAKEADIPALSRKAGELLNALTKSGI